jgi:hypothetical protein
LEVVSVNATEAIAQLDSIGGGDPEGAHGEADHVLLVLVDPDVAAAYQRLVGRCRWWACA